MRGVSRKITKIMLLLLALAALIAFTLPLHDGKPLLALAPGTWPSLPAIERLQWLRPQGEALPPVTVYRWRNHSGNWQYSSSPPADGIAHESITLDPNANILPSVTAAEPVRADDTTVTAPATPAPYSAEGIRQLFEDARRLRDQSLERRDATDPLQENP